MRLAYRCHNVEENSKVGVKAKAETGTCGCPKAVCWVPAGGTGDPLVCLPMGDGHPVISPGIFHPFNPRGALAGAKLWERPCLGRICIPGPAGRAAAAPAAVALSSPCGPHERPLPSRGGPGWGGQGARAGGSQVPRGEWGAWEGRGLPPTPSPALPTCMTPMPTAPTLRCPKASACPPPTAPHKCSQILCLPLHCPTPLLVPPLCAPHCTACTWVPQRVVPPSFGGMYAPPNTTIPRCFRPPLTLLQCFGGFLLP